MSKLYTLLRELQQSGKLTLMETVAVAAACELAVAAEHEDHIGRKVYPVLKNLLKDPVPPWQQMEQLTGESAKQPVAVATKCSCAQCRTAHLRFPCQAKALENFEVKP